MHSDKFYLTSLFIKQIKRISMWKSKTLCLVPKCSFFSGVRGHRGGDCVPGYVMSYIVIHCIYISLVARTSIYTSSVYTSVCNQTNVDITISGIHVVEFYRSGLYTNFIIKADCIFISVMYLLGSQYACRCTSMTQLLWIAQNLTGVQSKVT